MHDIPIASPTVAPNSLALRMDDVTFEDRRLRVSSSASDQVFILMLPMPSSVHSHCVGRTKFTGGPATWNARSSVPPLPKPHAWISASSVSKAVAGLKRSLFCTLARSDVLVGLPIRGFSRQTWLRSQLRLLALCLDGTISPPSRQRKISLGKVYVRLRRTCWNLNTILTVSSRDLALLSSPAVGPRRSHRLSNWSYDD